MPGVGLPTIQGVIILFDYESGEPKAMIDGASVTGLRTAAASALATQILARPEAKTLGIIGIACPHYLSEAAYQVTVLD